ncbi:MAG: family 16 glycosylhydrolase, partial [Myxococcota bacterium]
YKIEWSRSRLDFFIDDRHVFEFTNPGEIPQRAMPVFLNSWVPDADWADAYSGAIQPAFNGNQRQWFNMLVDWVRVTEVW